MSNNTTQNPRLDEILTQATDDPFSDPEDIVRIRTAGERIADVHWSSPERGCSEAVYTAAAVLAPLVDQGGASVSDVLAAVASVLGVDL